VATDARRNPPEPGRLIRRRAQGAKADALANALCELDPVLLEWTDSFIFGEVWGREGLEFEERMLVAITALASLGQIPQLRNYLHGALQAGIPSRKIQEGLLMTSVYAGFPAALNALACFKDVRAIHSRQSD
jgi:4-carboxymuconolactone decarboxylase